jgi:hypothetical protein
MLWRLYHELMMAIDDLNKSMTSSSQLMNDEIE